MPRTLGTKLTAYDLLLIEGAQIVLLRQGSKRFGPPDPRIVAALGEIGELERMEQLAERLLLDVSSWDELLAAPCGGQQQGRPRSCPTLTSSLFYVAGESPCRCVLLISDLYPRLFSARDALSGLRLG